MGLIARIRGLAPRQLRAALALLVAINLGIGAYVLFYLPVFRLYPTCHDDDALFGPTVALPGEMAAPFFYEYLSMIAGYDYFVRGRRIYVTLANWLDQESISRLSNKATVKLLAERTRASESDIQLLLLGLPEFDDVRAHEWPPCGAMRKLALEGGEWSRIGPVPKQAIAK
jgi:hypothetical protein